MAFSMAPRRPIGAPDLAMASLRPALPRARIRASVASAYLPERASRLTGPLEKGSASPLHSHGPSGCCRKNAGKRLSTNSIAPALLPPLHCCARVSVITAAACAGVCMVLLIVFSQCFPDSSVQNFRRNFAVVMGPCTSRYGPKVSRNLGGFLRNNETKFGWVLNETWTQAKRLGGLGWSGCWDALFFGKPVARKCALGS